MEGRRGTFFLTFLFAQAVPKLVIMRKHGEKETRQSGRIGTQERQTSFDQAQTSTGKGPEGPRTSMDTRRSPMATAEAKTEGP